MKNIEETLKQHLLYLESGGESGTEADLRWANLHNADLSFADLSFANLHNADLSFADLSFANLHNADLHKANLHNADLSFADLHNADLHNADLHKANLHNADLSFANLHNADLSFADLHNADLHNADLHKANLHNADLSFANLHNADLRWTGRFLTARIDPRGFEIKVWKEKDGVWVSSGCKTMPLQEAKTHWGVDYSPSCLQDKVGSIDIGKRYLDAIAFLVTLL